MIRSGNVVSTVISLAVAACHLPLCVVFSADIAVAQSSGTFTATGNMNQACAGHTAK